MGADARSWPRICLLLLAALDSLATGGVALLRPGDLFFWLQLPATTDRMLLCRVLGALMLTHVPCLTPAALRPVSWSGLIYVPLLGRALLAAIWLWLLNADRVHPSRPALSWLLVHDAVWLPIFAAFLVWAPRASKDT
jgi:hypothetical protein